jgi:SagB-type dehydrogenase family enzyme
MESMHGSRIDRGKVCVVRDYHERTKHRPDRYAASPGYMDWKNQPNPFRTYSETEQINLSHPDLRNTPIYDDLFYQSPAAAKLDANLVSRLLYHSLALSAWKQAPQIRPWSLRINPSSGALYPTEGYLVSGSVPDLIDHPGVFHYAPFRHLLERRCRLSTQQWERLTQGLPAPCLLIGLTSIYWRESWKYGERAFRYCHHDVGHAIGAITFSARVSGWQTRLLETIADEDLNRLLGTHLQAGIEAEHADCLLVLYPTGDGLSDPPVAGGWSPGQWRVRVPDAVFTGNPNRLSRNHRQWTAIEEVLRATRNEPADDTTLPAFSPYPDPIPQGTVPTRKHPAEQIIRQRRSAVDMDGKTSLDRAVFFQMLQRTLPAYFPFAALPWNPRVSLAIFVHRVKDLPPGLYLFSRNAAHERELRNYLRSDLQWRQPEGCPREMLLYRLFRDDVRRTAKVVSCHQDIAGDGVFSVGMLAEFDSAIAGGKAWNYPRLFWECGLIGQVLYLEAEAAGIQGTGIGCFFDDVMHDLLGITGHSWQSLYHFTAGGPVVDTRLKTIFPYAHLVAGTPGSGGFTAPRSS